MKREDFEDAAAEFRARRQLEETACDRWWHAPDRDDREERTTRAADLTRSVRELEDSQRGAHEQNLWNARCYSNRELVHFDWGHGQFYSPGLTPISLLGENLVLSVVETMVSRAGRNRTKVTPVPRGASWKTRRVCRRLDKWLYGEFVRNSVWERVVQMFRDALVFGFGCVRVDHKDGHPVVRRVFPDDFVVDQTEVAADPDGQPAHVYERRCRRVEEVEHAYNLPEGSLRGNTTGAWLSYRAPGRGWVVVVEGYRRGPAGRHVVACEDKLLVDEPWEHDWVPYAWYHTEAPLSGFYWPSVVERVLPFQIRLNEINEVIRDAQDLMARPRVLVAEGSRVTAADIDNLTARIIRYAGTKPEALTWEAVSGELYQERERQVRACFEQFGLMPLAAQGKLPQAARLDSSAALQEAVAIGDDRLADPLQRLEDFILRLARLMIEVMRDSGEGQTGETVWFSGGRRARSETIRWDEVNLAETAYTLTLEAASLFSMTPAARRDKLEGWFAKGLITVDQLWEYDQNPDLENEQSIRRAAAEDISRVIEMLEDGKYESPHPAQDLVSGTQRVTLAYLRLGEYDDVPDEVAENFLRWISMAQAVMNPATTAPPTSEAEGGALQQPAGMPPLGMPPGAGGPMGGMPGGMPPVMGPPPQGGLPLSPGAPPVGLSAPVGGL